MKENNITFNYDKLTGKIIEKYKTRENFATQIPMSVPTLINKLSGKVDFKNKEVFKICELLDIPLEQMQYFFYQTT